MTIEEFAEQNELDEMTKLYEMKNFVYWIEKRPENEDIGEPIVVEENKSLKSFKICDYKQMAAVLKLVYG